MTPKERLLAVLNREKVDRSPVAVPTQNATVDVMRIAGVYWPQALREAEPMARLAMACQEQYGFESIRLPFDINVEAETMGCATRYGEEGDPPISSPKDRENLGEIRFPNPATSGRMEQVIKAVAIAARRRNPDIPIIAALGTPFEVLSTIYNFDHLYSDLKSDPQGLEELLEKILGLLTAYAAELEGAGADVLMVVDGTSQTLMPDQFRQFSAPYTTRLIGSFHAPAILHICGNPTRLIADMSGTGARGLSLDSSVLIEKARENSGGKVALVGNLGVRALQEGTPADVADMTRVAIKEGWDIVAPGCGIIPATPLQNIISYVDTVKDL
ncbi:MAG: MtaA/CmuA family methyltransferase [Nitrospinota bacterium]|nr:MtaA/CmuA family methyltransferase [Nitrospinota bacterium]